MQRRSHILRLIADLLTAELLSFPPFTELGKTTTLRKQETIQTDTVSWLHLGEQQMRIYQSLPGSVVSTEDNGGDRRSTLVQSHLPIALSEPGRYETCERSCQRAENIGCAAPVSNHASDYVDQNTPPTASHDVLSPVDRTIAGPYNYSHLTPAMPMARPSELPGDSR